MEMTISYKGGKKFVAPCRSHNIVIDQPLDNDGKDEGPTPPELFIASLGSCIGVYVLAYCKNAGIKTEGMAINVKWEKAKNPDRIGEIKVDIKLPEDVGKRKAALLKVAEHCLIHNTIHHQPKIEINLSK
ncbi:MAG: hypothetical protein A3C43_00535 [Candidatus Schekmanbacteria bacterium RIFCSPHIGHO2_02_FULL_38_11]|uniref:Osmotically inducible protein OsmC n=1 Tax=Candidatus Schekmanbacteria bacterium RIFCSPLOWO2_12_FULL_38_15 TaxID=1817883 RepID=A0A1F7SND5_9BACT|nr:MAG: hypothetical protein A2043_03695 [Candidatus Schekmanbacteria bacterium GWA2_38_9]OGL48404.1 MAG: hypothetical protein A3H37_05370 [Candidatus Schekmanbacteria bacterium RIFCSPLOWO2_02_FULL_38_14]OGL51998.1 MAG: hypothetical protein A3C43_00535 [Candidatus Schekmanbacteria bacterium RIFCSPHIGHO2_02_FULL_38_11]OGL55286.1 MAG: hypothetical protein A3G31_04570 [Candidatus Schekmanbacteria bacterium RIFCSPLOWO2_12_FULL_38_15]